MRQIGVLPLSEKVDASESAIVRQFTCESHAALLEEDPRKLMGLEYADLLRTHVHTFQKLVPGERARKHPQLMCS